MINRIRARSLALGIVLLATTPAAHGQEAAAPGRPPSVAVLEIENVGMDPRVDYLSGIIGGLLAYDLGSQPGLVLADRRNLDAVLREHELTLSALGTDAAAAAEAGRLVGADWLLTGEYLFTGSDVLLTLSLTDAATARRVVFRDRGGDENLVHRLAEQLVLRLTGERASLAEAGRSRSLVSLRDETPGSVALFSPIVRAEVFLDGEFVGYTTGDGAVPLVLEGLSPGQHVVRVHLDSSFGVVDLPEVRFRDWEASVSVAPGKRATLRDGTRHFNDVLYPLIEVGSGEVVSLDAKEAPDAPARALAFSKKLGFTDRGGAEVDVEIEAVPRPTKDGIVLELTVSTRPKGDADSSSSSASASIAMASSERRDREGSAEAGIVRLRAGLRRRADSWVLSWRVERTDIRQNMWSE